MARVHTDAEVARLLLHQKRYEIVGESDFTRDAVRIQEALRRLIRLLRAFQPYTAQVSRDAWDAARLPPVASDSPQLREAPNPKEEPSRLKLARLKGPCR